MIVTILKVKVTIVSNSSNLVGAGVGVAAKRVEGASEGAADTRRDIFTKVKVPL